MNVLTTLLAEKRILSTDQLAEILDRSISDVETECRQHRSDGYLIGDALGWELTGTGARVAGSVDRGL